MRFRRNCTRKPKIHQKSREEFNFDRESSIASAARKVKKKMWKNMKKFTDWAERGKKVCKKCAKIRKMHKCEGILQCANGQKSPKSRKCGKTCSALPYCILWHTALSGFAIDMVTASENAPHLKNHNNHLFYHSVNCNRNAQCLESRECQKGAPLRKPGRCLPWVVF